MNTVLSEGIEKEDMMEKFKVKGYEIHIEELSGKRKFYLDMDTMEMHPFERKFLSANLCRVMLPVHFLKLGDKERIYYDFTGTVALKDYIFGCRQRQRGRLPAGENMQVALSLFGRIMKAIREGEDCLLFLERYYLGNENVFIEPYTGEVKLAYLPERNGLASVRMKLLSCLDDIAELFRDPEVTNMIGKMKAIILDSNLGVEGIIKAASSMQRELKIAYGF